MSSRVLRLAGTLAIATAVAAGCMPDPGSAPGEPGGPGPVEAADHFAGRLGARPDPSVATKAPTGRRAFPAAGERALLFVPSSYRPGRALPFAVLFHGCCGATKPALGMWLGQARSAGMILLAPDPGTRWTFGEPVAMLDDALAKVFSRYAVDPERVAAVGFSDGGTWALSLGLTNGDLFTHLVPHSPGGMVPGERIGEPKVFVIHGTEDGVLPIDRTSDEIVPALRDGGYDVRYVRFDAGHRQDPASLDRAARWFLPDYPS